MNRFSLLVVAVVAAGVMGLVQPPAHAVDNETVPTITQCANGDFNNGTGLCDCNVGFHRTGDNHCDANGADPPWVPPLSPAPTNPGPGGIGGSHPSPPTHGPKSKACKDCKDNRQVCVNGTDAAWVQCNSDIPGNAKHICESEGIGADGISYPPTFGGYHEGPPCRSFSHDQSHECLAWSLVPTFEANETCVETFLYGFDDYNVPPNQAFRLNKDWLNAQNKSCSDKHLADMNACNNANKCETTVCL